MPAPQETTLEQRLLTALKAAKESYKASCKLLRDPRQLKPTQRLVRQEIVKDRLKILNELRGRLGLAPKAGPRLLSIDELLQPKVQASPEALQAALSATEARPGFFCVVAQFDGTTALAA